MKKEALGGLSQLLGDSPEVDLTKVEFLTNSKRANEDGVSSIPTLVSGDQTLSGFLLSKKRIRNFLESL